MAYILALLQFFIVGLVVLYEYIKKSLAVFLWAMIFVMFSLIHFVNVFTGNFVYPLWVYNNASIFVIAFTLLYFFTRIILLRKRCAISNEINIQSVINLRIDEPINKRFIIYSLIVLLITMGYSCINLAKISGGLFNSSWGSSYLYYSTQAYISFDKIIQWFFLPCGSIFLIGLVSKRSKLIILTSIPIILYVAISRNKADLLTLITGIILYFLLKNKDIKIKNIIMLFVLGIISIYIIYALQTFRHLGTLSEIVGKYTIEEFHKIVMSEILSGQGEFGLINVFYYFIYHNNNFPDFNQYHTYIRMALLLIPSSYSFGLKPSDFAISMGSAWIMDMNNSTFSTHPTFFGDVFANASYLGVFLGIFWAIFVMGIDKLADRKNILLRLNLMNLIASNYILIGRGSVYNSYASMVYGALIIFAIYFIARIRIK